MYWSKVKSILIVLFILVNIFLLYFVMTSYNKVSYISDDTVKNTVEILRSKNIDISPTLINKKMEKMSIVEVNNILADRQGFLSTILGSTYTTQGNIYANSNAQVTFSPDRVKINFLYPLPIESGNIVNNVVKKLSALGIELNGKNSISAIEQSGTTTVTIKQFYDDRPIIESVLTVKAVGTDLSEIEGYYVKQNKNTPIATIPARHITGILISLLGNNDLDKFDTQITKIELAYSMGNNERISTGKIITLIPAYCITFNSGKSFIYDASSGEYLKTIS